MTEEEIMIKAKNHVGVTPQLLKLAEEANELGASILRFTNRAPWSRPEETLFMEMLEELMDVDLMVQQVKLYLDDEVLGLIRRKKLDRYENRVISLEKT
jgi:hypothetical protein